MRALILPGGGARGILQTGMYAAYLEQYKTYDFICGTSVGSLNAIFIAQNEMFKMLELWRHINNCDVFTWNLLNAFGPKGSLMDITPLAALIHQTLDINKLKQSGKPFYASTTRINPLAAVTKNICNMTQEEAEKWVLASASAPMAFPVQVINGKQYSDGGLTRNFGISHAIALGATDIVVLCCGAMNSSDVKNLFDMIKLQLSVQSAAQFTDETELAQILNKSQHTVSLTVYKPDSIDLKQLDFTGASRNYKKYYEQGYNIMNKPALQFRKVAQTGMQPRWQVFH
jgi:predicted acylesterase/phospholipase RssA